MQEPMAIYMASLRRCPRFSAAEERELAVRAKAGDRQARESLILSVMPWAMRLVQRYKNRGLDIEDLIQIANVEVIKSVDRLDPDKGRLTTIVALRVRQKIFAAINENGVIRVPHSFGYKSCTASEISRERAEAARRVLSLEQSSDKNDWLNTLQVQPSEIAEEDQEIAALRRAINRLADRRWLVVKWRLEGWTLRDIANVLQCTREWIRQIEKSARKQIYKWITEEPLHGRKKP